jgi:hypothetical protein
MTMRVRIQLLAIRALLEHFNWELFDHPLYSLDLASSSYRLCTYLKNWLGSQRFNSNVPKRVVTHRRQTSLTQAYKNLFPDMTSASIPAVTVLRSSLCMYVFFVYKFFQIDGFVTSSWEVTMRIAVIFKNCINFVQKIKKYKGTGG